MVETEALGEMAELTGGWNMQLPAGYHHSDHQVGSVYQVVVIYHPLQPHTKAAPQVWDLPPVAAAAHSSRQMPLVLHYDVWMLRVKRHLHQVEIQVEVCHTGQQKHFHLKK